MLSFPTLFKTKKKIKNCWCTSTLMLCFSWRQSLEDTQLQMKFVIQENVYTNSYYKKVTKKQVK